MAQQLPHHDLCMVMVMHAAWSWMQYDHAACMTMLHGHACGMVMVMAVHAEALHTRMLERFTQPWACMRVLLGSGCDGETCPMLALGMRRMHSTHLLWGRPEQDTPRLAADIRLGARRRCRCGRRR